MGRWVIGIVWLTVILSLAACGEPVEQAGDGGAAAATPTVGAPAGSAESGATAAVSPTPTEATSATTSPTKRKEKSVESPSERQAVEAARKVLAQKAGVGADKLKLVSVAAQEWNDSSLGCPEEGMMYMQVITPGYKVVLEADGKQYEAHTDRAGRAVTCQDK